MDCRTNFSRLFMATNVSDTGLKAKIVYVVGFLRTNTITEVLKDLGKARIQNQNRDQSLKYKIAKYKGLVLTCIKETE